MYGQAPPSLIRVKGRNTDTAGAVKSLVGSYGVGYKIWISKLTVSNTSATATQVQILSGATIIWTIPAPAGGGAVEVFPDPIDCAENQGLNFQTDNGVTTMTVSMAGYVGLA